MRTQRSSPRRGVTTIFFVLLFAAILAILFGAQHLRSRSVYRRARLAELGRRALSQAEGGVVEALRYLEVAGNNPEHSDRALDPDDFPTLVRQLSPGRVVEFELEPEATADWGATKGTVRGETRVHVRMMMRARTGFALHESSQGLSCDALVPLMVRVFKEWYEKYAPDP